jgi:hypothetical protein
MIRASVYGRAISDGAYYEFETHGHTFCYGFVTLQCFHSSHRPPIRVQISADSVGDISSILAVREGDSLGAIGELHFGAVTIQRGGEPVDCTLQVDSLFTFSRQENPKDEADAAARGTPTLDVDPMLDIDPESGEVLPH